MRTNYIFDIIIWPYIATILREIARLYKLKQNYFLKVKSNFSKSKPQLHGHHIIIANMFVHLYTFYRHICLYMVLRTRPKLVNRAKGSRVEQPMHLLHPILTFADDSLPQRHECHPFCILLVSKVNTELILFEFALQFTRYTGNIPSSVWYFNGISVTY